MQAGTADGIAIGRMGRAALILSAAFMFIGLFSIGVMLPGITAAAMRDGQPWLAAGIGSVAPPAFALASPPMGHVVARFGYRRVYVAGLVAFVLVGGAPGLLDNLWLVLLSRVLVGVAVAAVMTAALDGIAHLPSERHAGMFGLQAAAGGLIAMGVYALIGLLARHGWHLPFLIYLLGLPIAPLVLALPEGRHALLPPAAPASGGLLAGLAPSLCLFAATSGMILFLVNLVGPFMLVHVGVTDPAVATLPFTAMSLAGTVGAACYGPVHRRLGTANTFIVVTQMLVLGLGACCLARALPAFVAGMVLLGIGQSFGMPNLYTAALQTTRSPPSQALGVINGIIYFVPLALPPIIAVLRSMLGVRGPFVVYGAASLGWMVWFAWRRFRVAPDL